MLSHYPYSNRWLQCVLACGLLFAGLFGLMLGSIHLGPQEVLHRLMKALFFDVSNEVADRILISARLPRVLLAASVGASLALVGMAAQILFRNPLATPSLIGVSNGSALGAVLGMLLLGSTGWSSYSIVPLFSILSGLAVTLFVYVLGRQNRFFGYALLLAGIATSSLCSSLTTAALYLAGERLQSIVFWLMGGLWRANWNDVIIMLPLTALTTITLLILAPSLNIALMGERSAHDLGLNLPRLQRQLLVLIALTTSVAVSLTGVIGFIGLIVPHLLRLILGADHRRLVLSTAMGGALLLVVSDTLARTLAAPVEIPVGILTALVGAPMFLWLLNRKTGRLIS